jgi:hypothetical protein
MNLTSDPGKGLRVAGSLSSCTRDTRAVRLGVTVSAPTPVPPASESCDDSNFAARHLKLNRG